jgi:ABC-2 type transport system ATP-binding protein
MSELEDAADRLVVIGRGRLVAEPDIADLLASVSGKGVRLRTPKRSEVMGVLAAAGATVTSSGSDELSVTGLDAARIAELTADRGLPLYELTSQRATLEEAFTQLTRDAVEFGDGRP